MHIPVLKNEIIESFSYLAHREKTFFIDGTLGLAGHTIALLQAFPNLHIIGLDKDNQAIALSHEKLVGMSLADRVTIVHSPFEKVRAVLTELKIERIDGAMLDLGVSSLQLDTKNRGFSFQENSAPLDMRMDTDQDLTAAMVLNTYPETKLAKIIKEFGEEPFARQIARNIVIQRKNKPYEIVGDLIKTIEYSLPGKIKATSRVHFATKTFQAIRIEVNMELSRLNSALADMSDRLSSKSKLGVITFHSLEDRIVKTTFHSLEHPCTCPPKMPCICAKLPTAKVLTKKPIIPTLQEIQVNPRSRSAKLRIIEKI